jgi:hypothetical protein
MTRDEYAHPLRDCRRSFPMLGRRHREQGLKTVSMTIVAFA